MGEVLYPWKTPEICQAYWAAPATAVVVRVAPSFVTPVTVGARGATMRAVSPPETMVWVPTGG